MAGHEHAPEGHGGDKRIALLISVLALFLAMVETGGKSAQTDVITRNVEAANLWAFFQARTVRQTTVRTAAEQAELQKAGTPDAAARAAIEAQLKTWQDRAAAWESEPATGEGRKEIADRAREAEAQRERSLARYHFFEYSSALFEIGIVIASASIVTGVPLLALGSILLGLCGLGLGAVGFFAPQAFHLM